MEGGKFPCINFHVMLYILAKEFCFANWLSLFPSFLESVFVILNIAFLTSLFNVNKISSFISIFSFHFPFHSSYIEKNFLALSRYIFIYLLSYITITKVYLTNFLQYMQYCIYSCQNEVLDAFLYPYFLSLFIFKYFNVLK